MKNIEKLRTGAALASLIALGACDPEKAAEENRAINHRQIVEECEKDKSLTPSGDLLFVPCEGSEASEVIGRFEKEHPNVSIEGVPTASPDQVIVKLNSKRKN